ncbi:MAG: hypothetical protein JSW61_05765 [Candidatus Thorarchaeota archaeon]|nr:MAG: hypothetical protein JSW61_05765 [Candidatus Thorarchaeota archaeon]
MSTPQHSWTDGTHLAGLYMRMDSLARLPRAALGIMLPLFLLYPLMVIPGLFLLVLSSEIQLAEGVSQFALVVGYAQPRDSPPVTVLLK